MIIDKIKGDLVQLFAEGKIIAHGCNCFHAMASGVAGQLAEAYPIISEVDNCTNYGDVNKLGKFSIALNKEKGGCINLYTQYNPGRDGSYGAIATAFESLDKTAQKNPNIFKNGLYIPKIGCGIAGLEWTRVSNIINAVTPHIPIILVEWDNGVNPKVNVPKPPFIGLDVLLMESN